MYQLIETIKIKDGQIQLLSFHQERMNITIESLFHIQNKIELISSIIIPEHAKKGIWKCRIIYSTDIKEITFTPYIYRIINSLKIIEAPLLQYKFKFENREQFQELLLQKGNFDDIVITQNGNITDTSYSNIVFFDGKDWFTPTTFLLQGTKRTFLLESKKIKEKPITVELLNTFIKARLLNCFYDLENGNDIEISNIS